MLKKSCFILLITFALGNFSFADQKDKWSISIGQFDVNDTIDSSELRLELLYGNNFYENSYGLKPFIGAMLNGDSGKYAYTGLRKDFTVSKKWNFTPSFALGYYDRGDSKDLGHNLEFRSQIEFSYAMGENRIGFNLNHISNASLGDTNPGTESATVSLIRSF